MKKIKYLITCIISLLLFPIFAGAASGNISVSSTSTVVVGNTVTVTVTLSSGTPIGSWEMDLKYDKSFLQLTSSTAEAGGTYMVNAASTTSGVKSKSYTFKFKTLKKGNTNVSISSYYVVDNTQNDMSISAGSKTIKIITQEELEASYSKDNNLKSLGVENFQISPEFSKDTLEYSVVVPENTKEINIVASPNDSKSSVSGTGVKEVTSGVNTFQVVVRAENGAEKTYTLTVDVKDANPINVKVDGKDYTVVKIKENLPVANYYSEYTVKIDDFEIPAYKNDNTNIVLVGLKDSSGTASLFIYDEENKEYKAYHEIGINKTTILPLNTEDNLDGFNKGTVKIDELEVDCFYHDGEERFVVIYGINIEDGEKGFFLYDKDKQTLMKYTDSFTKDFKDKIQLYTYIIIGFSAILTIMFIIIIILLTKKKKRKPNISIPVMNKEGKNDIIEEKKVENELNYEEKIKKFKRKK